MARTVSWIPRLPSLLRSVQDSVRSHYSSRELEKLFEIQPRSAQMLLGVLPTVRIGRTLLVEREALVGFLERLNKASDPGQELSALRTAPKPPVIRRKLRELIRRDADTTLTSLPSNIKLEVGQLGIHFQNIEDLVQSLWRLAQVLEGDLEGFAERYEPAAKLQKEDADAQDGQDAAWITQWLTEHEKTSYI
ncbi:hypothetical protein ACOBR2_21500 (plasmid) [Telmatobacter bradus]|uniref:hypothetical protein n=1 Tax=Telmatobacter bradus TaxID=474953 RepID=UPI003B437054